MSSTGINKLDLFIDRINNIPINIFIEDSMRDNKEFNEDLIADQHDKGLSGTGDPLVPEYRNDEYARFKKGLGAKPPLGTPDLKLTGAFRRGITQRVERNRAVIFGKDKKTNELKFKYGEPILDYTNDSKVTIRLQIRPDLIEDTKNFIKNG